MIALFLLGALRLFGTEEYQLFGIGALDEAYVTSWKSSLNFNALALLISVLSNKAVLGLLYGSPYLVLKLMI